MIRRLADRLAPATIRQWADLCTADVAGCQTQYQPYSLDVWLENAERLGILDRPPTPILQGRDLIALGMPPGPEMGTILKAAFEAQLDGEFLTHEQAVEWLKTEMIQYQPGT